MECVIQRPVSAIVLSEPLGAARSPSLQAKAINTAGPWVRSNRAKGRTGRIVTRELPVVGGTVAPRAARQVVGRGSRSSSLTSGVQPILEVAVFRAPDRPGRVFSTAEAFASSVRASRRCSSVVYLALL
jgi:hypothetical protein